MSEELDYHHGMSKRDLKDVIRNLRREQEYRGREHRLEIAEKTLDLQKQAEKYQIEKEQMKLRLDESPYKQLQDILKALVVKLPTLDIKELHAHRGDK